MIGNALRMLTDAAKDGTIGLDAQLADMPLEAPETIERIPIITNSTEKPSLLAVEPDWGPDYPIGAFTLGGIARPEATPSQKGAQLARFIIVPVRFSFAVDDADLHVGLANGYRVLWALVRFLKVFFRESNVAFRRRNDVFIDGFEKLDEPIALGDALEALEDGEIVVGADFNLRVKDENF